LSAVYHDILPKLKSEALSSGRTYLAVARHKKAALGEERGEAIERAVV
jgi:hypothetical protein